jgi:hypothetical protein
MEDVIASVPPWAALATFLGVMHGALFHLFFGSGFRQLGAQLSLGALASLAGGLVGTIIPPAIFAIGETNLLATALGAWLTLGIARLFRFC